jgi:hypothetical protein
MNSNSEHYYGKWIYCAFVPYVASHHMTQRACHQSFVSLARLSSMGLAQYEEVFGKGVSEEAENVARLTREEFQSRNWTAAHLRLGEMEVSFISIFTTPCLENPTCKSANSSI